MRLPEALPAAQGAVGARMNTAGPRGSAHGAGGAELQHERMYQTAPFGIIYGDAKWSH